MCPHQSSTFKVLQKSLLTLFSAIHISSADIIALLDSGGTVNGSGAALVDLSTAGDSFSGSASFSSSTAASSAASSLNTGFSDHRTEIPSRVWGNNRLNFFAGTNATATWEFSGLTAGEEWEVLVYQQEITQMRNATNLQLSLQGVLGAPLDQRYTSPADFVAEFTDGGTPYYAGYRSLGKFDADENGVLSVAITSPADADGILVADSVVIRKKTAAVSEFADDLLIIIPENYNQPYVYSSFFINEYEKTLEYLNGLYDESANHQTVEAHGLRILPNNTTGLRNSNMSGFHNPDRKNQFLFELQKGYESVVIFENLEILKERPGAIFEYVRQLSEIALPNGSQLYFAVNGGTEADLEVVAEHAERIANGVGIHTIPVGQILNGQELYVDDLTVTGENTAQYLYGLANTIFTTLSGESAFNTNYTATYLNNRTVSGTNTIANAVDSYLANDYETSEAYTGSFAERGSYVYRSIDLSQAPHSNNVAYFRKGTSTERGLNAMISQILPANGLTFTDISIGEEEGDTRNIREDDLIRNATTLANTPALFMFSRGADVASTTADTYTSADVLNFTFSYSFSWWWSDMAPVYENTPRSTEILLQNAGGVWETSGDGNAGWNYIPFHLGLTRVYADNPRFIGTDDQVHQTDDMRRFAAGMMLTSALGMDIQPNALIRNNESVLRAFNIGKKAMKDFAHLSETSEDVPDTNLKITTESLPVCDPGSPYTVQLTTTGGAGNEQWEVHSAEPLPPGLILASNGTLSGTVYQTHDPQIIVFKVTDALGGFRKAALELTFSPAGYAQWIGTSAFNVPLTTNDFNQDADQDGITNGIEYYLGTPPNEAEGVGLSMHSTSPFALSHPIHRPALDFVTPTYEWSPNLIDFYEDGASDGTTTVTFQTARLGRGIHSVTPQITTSLADVPHLFIRLKVTDKSSQ